MCSFKKQAVGFINFSVIDLSKNESFNCQKRYSSLSALENGIKNCLKRKTKKEEFGYKESHYLINVEEICFAMEYANYLVGKYKTDKLTLLHGRKLKNFVKSDSRVINDTINSNLSLDIVLNFSKVLGLDRQAIKEKYDAIAGVKKESEKKPKVRKSRTTSLTVYERNLGKVVDFARKSNISFNKEDYKNVFHDIDWTCNKCGDTFNVSFKRLSQRKNPCLNCLKDKKKGAGVIENVKVFAKKHKLTVDYSNYYPSKYNSSKLDWTCKHGTKESVSIRSMKRRANEKKSCIVCDYKK